MSYLVHELVTEWGTQAEVARRTGLGQTYVGQLYNAEKARVGGISADIIQLLLDKVGLDPMYFFDKWPDGKKKSYKLYLLSEQREKRRIESLESELAKLRAEQAAEREETRDAIRALSEQMAALSGTPLPASPIPRHKLIRKPEAG